MTYTRTDGTRAAKVHTCKRITPGVTSFVLVISEDPAVTLAPVAEHLEVELAPPVITILTYFTSLLRQP